MVDMVVQRAEMRELLVRLLRFLWNVPPATAVHEPVTGAAQADTVP